MRMLLTRQARSIRQRVRLVILRSYDRATGHGLNRTGFAPDDLASFARAYFTRFHANSAVPPTDAVGLVYFSSSAVSDEMIRF